MKSMPPCNATCSVPPGMCAGFDDVDEPPLPLELDDEPPHPAATAPSTTSPIASHFQRDLMNLPLGRFRSPPGRDPTTPPPLDARSAQELAGRSRIDRVAQPVPQQVEA